MSRLRFFILCLLGGFLAVLGVLLWNVREFPGFKLGSLKDMLPPNIDMRLSNLILDQAGTDGRSLALKALSASYFKEQDYFLLTGVNADVLTLDGAFSVKADTGRYEPEASLVVLTGSVRTADGQGRILSGPKLTLDMGRGVFSSEDPFCLTEPMMDLSGESFVYDTKKGILEVEGQVRLMLGRAQ
ncbi:MAG: LPS export ABC transporter periplasmic protein LptC [Deltaproteobacteria bacterium]|jgi:LPS export ABC transporter protein LptC|nr:LPS export ABC transporter periplasmic protein LptC [Deltaproteobacteria bacterium]